MSRRWRYPRTRRGEFFDPPRNASQPVDRLRRTPRLSLWQRRGRFFQTPPPQVQQAAPSLIPAFIRQRLRLGARTRRGVYWPNPLTTTPPQTPSWAPDGLTASRVRLASARRGRFLSSPQTAAQPPQYVTGRRVRTGQPRRGAFLPLPLIGLAPTSPAAPPQGITGRRAHTGPLRRGHFAAIPLAGLAPVQPSPLPSLVNGRRSRIGPPRRGRFHAVPPAGLVPAPPPVPPQFLRPRVKFWYPRRGLFNTVPPGQLGAPQWIGNRRHTVSIRRRGQFFTCPSQVPLQPSVWRPEILSSHRRPWRPVRRGCFYEPPWPQVPPPLFSRGEMHGRPRTGSDASGAVRSGPEMTGRSRTASSMGGGG